MGRPSLKLALAEKSALVSIWTDDPRAPASSSPFSYPIPLESSLCLRSRQGGSHCHHYEGKSHLHGPRPEPHWISIEGFPDQKFVMSHLMILQLCLPRRVEASRCTNFWEATRRRILSRTLSSFSTYSIHQ